MKILLPFLVLILTAQIFAQAQTKCFRNEGLKDNHIVRFEADGADVAGSYFVEPDGEPENTQTFDFSGTRSGNRLSVKFAGDAPAGIAPSKTKVLIWTLAQTANGEILRIKFYGKNYETNKFADYTADFAPCEPDYAMTANKAKRITFAKGAKSVTLPLSFTNKTERRSFLLGARKDQTVAVTSIGCAISFFYPDKTAYEEGAGIDVLTLEHISQTGDYLFIISPAGNAGKCSTTIKISN